MTGNNQTFAIGSATTSGGTCIAIGANGSFSATATCSGADSLAVGNGASATNQAASAFGVGSQALGVGATAVGFGATAGAENGIALGTSANAVGTGAVAIGNTAKTASANQIAIGNDAQAAGGVGVPNNAAVSIGWRSRATGQDAVALGDNAQATGVGTVALGPNTTASGFAGTALGPNATASGTNATALGYVANAASENSTAVGHNAQALQAGAVALGDSATTAVAVGTANATINGNAYTFAGTTPGSTVSVGSVGAERTITNVAAGRLSNTSTDAVNGSQLARTNEALGSVGATVTTITDGGGIKYFRANSSGKDSQALALESVAIGPNAVANNEGDVALGSGSTTDAAIQTTGATINGTAVTFAGSAPTSTVSVGSVGAERTITNVAAGRLGNTSTDAVNGSQLSATNTEVGKIGTQVDGIVNNGAGIKYFHANSTAADSSATGDDSVAIGGQAIASGAGSFAAGAGAQATGAMAIAIGQGAQAAGESSISVGTGSIVSGKNSGAFGDPNNVAGSGSYAFGNNNTVSANNAFVLGNNVMIAAGFDGAVVLGSGSAGNRAAGVVGYAAPPATAAQVAAINATTGTRSAVSVGDAANDIFRQITGVAAGSADSDAVNVAQLKAVNANAVASASKWVAGSQTASYVAPSATGAESTAVGSGSSATGNNSVAIGTGASASTANSVALGNGSTTSVAVAVANTTILGTTYDFAGATPAGVVSIGSAGAERQITHVAAGQLTTGSTDAVNGSQLYTTNQAINNMAVGGAGIRYFHSNSKAADSQAAGGESVAIGPQAVSQATGSVALGAGAVADRAGMSGQKELFSNATVSSTQGAVSVGSTGNERQVTNVAGGTQATDAVNVRQLQAARDGSVQYDKNPDGTVSRASVTMGGGQASSPVAVHNVATGVAGTDAVNVNQLNTGVASANEYTDARINKVQGDLSKISKQADAGTAGALAAANLPQAYVPGKGMLSVGVGGFGGEAALAMGVSKLSDSGRWVMKFSGTANSRGKVGVGAGAGFVW
ncbi:YadA-like family protein [Variovorax sp. LT1R16]|uniref:YadA-like family protein n=1 Tax=Variovorax sp. LT1R16 TaxID=3443728 RepID=UPI003F44A081